MWGKFVKEFRAAPIPDFIKKDYELRTSYYGALDDASEPQKQQAKGAFEVCLGYSVKYQYFDTFSRACEEWLAQNYKNEYHLVDEFRGAPNRVNSVLKEQGNPLRIGGSPIAAQTPQEPEKKKPAASDEKSDDKKSDSKGDDKKSEKSDKKDDEKKSDDKKPKKVLGDFR
jgi:Mg-chelatase subunit ChlI